MLASIHALKASNCLRFPSQTDAAGAFLALFNAVVSTFSQSLLFILNVKKKFIQTGKHQKLPARKFM